MLLAQEVKVVLLLLEDLCLHLLQWDNNHLQPKDQVSHHPNSNQLLHQWALVDPDQWQQILLHQDKVHHLWAVQEAVKLTLDLQSTLRHLPVASALSSLSTNNLNRIRN